MMYSQAWHAYRQVSTQTAPPGQLVAMLFDGTLRFLEQALAGFEHEDPLEFNQTINNNILRAQAILGELNQSLDLERGGELAATLRRLYVYLEGRLQHSNLYKRPEGIREALKHLRVLRDAWHQMLRGAHDTPAAQEPHANLSACV